MLLSEGRETSLSESPSEFSSSDSGFARFFGAALVTLRVVCLVAFGAAAFFAGALAGAFVVAFDFCAV